MSEHIRLLQLSKRFLTAARDLSQQGGEGWRYPVPHYLAGHGLELALKAHLAHKGMTKRILKDLGHDLVAVLAQADVSVASLLTPQQVIAIGWFNPYYRGKELEYPAQTTGLKSVPRASYFMEAAEKVMSHLDPIFRAEVRSRRVESKK